MVSASSPVKATPTIVRAAMDHCPDAVIVTATVMEGDTSPIHNRQVTVHQLAPQPGKQRGIMPPILLKVLAE